MQRSKFMNIAHRGASAYAPENTFSSFDKALSLGVDEVELDVHFTSDGHIVVIHDDLVDRTTSGSGPVTGHTLEQLKALDAGSWFGPQYAGEPIRSLGEVLERYKDRLYFHLEIKGCRAGLTERTVDLVRGYGLSGSVTITSFDKTRLKEVRAYAPQLPAGWLVGECDDAVLDQAEVLGLSMLCPRADLVTPDLVTRLRSRGFVIRAWGVATEELMRSVVDAGADGMTINFPDKLTAYLKSGQSG
ncbi:MAG: glycerophosphodiester phosphodiesterase [Dehalococcoidia bacterium]